jgi:hypothetical protein
VVKVSINSPHTAEHIDHLLSVLEAAIKKFDIPVNKRPSSDWDAFIKESPDYILETIGQQPG